MKLENKTYSSPRWSWEILDCAMPMTFDTYSNCAHQCVYCFAFFQRGVGASADDYLHHKVKSVDVDKVKKLFRGEMPTSQFNWYIENRYVLQWGGLSDGFDWYERKFRKSLELLKFFISIDYPISISTKGTWFWDDPEYLKVLEGAKNVHFKYSIITADDEHAKKLEAGTPTTSERFAALRRAKEVGVGGTTFRFRPFILGTSDIGAEELFSRAREAGVYSATTEFLCLESRVTKNHLARYKIISDVIGFDVWEFYRKNTNKKSGLLRLNYDIKRPYIEKLRMLSKKNGIKFFVSDAHHKEASLGGGCCGLPDNGVLSNYHKGQFSEAINIAKKNGEVRWSDISSDAEGLKNIPFGLATGFNQGTTQNKAKQRFHTMFDFMRDNWNKITSWNSPARYFGGALVPRGLDDNGDVIYLYNEPFVNSGMRVKTADELAEHLNRIDVMSADGGAWGHVAFPVYVDDGVDASPLARERINYEPFDVYDVAHNYAYWHITDTPEFGKGETVRSIMSEAENELSEAVTESVLARVPFGTLYCSEKK